MNRIILGDKVRDKVSGYEGIATARTEYLNGCFQIEITSKLKKGEKITAESLAGVAIDEKQLERIGDGINIPKKRIEKSNNGGPMRILPKRLY